MYYGVEPTYYYVFMIMPLYFTALYPFVMASFYVYLRDMYKASQTPYILYLTAMYTIVFSLIAHKEPRFLLPVIPFCFLLLGYLL